MPLGRARPQSPQLEKVIGKEFDRRRPITSPTFFASDSVRPDAKKNKRRIIFVRQADGTFTGQYSDGANWQSFLATSVSYTTPAITYGTTAAAGSATTTIRSDSRLKYPTALMSSANSSTVTLTDDATNQTLTGSLGSLVIAPAPNQSISLVPGGASTGNTCNVTINTGGSALNYGLQPTFQSGNLSSQTVGAWNVAGTFTSQYVTSTIVGYDISSFSISPAAGSDTANKMYGARLLGPLINNATGGFTEVASLSLSGARRLVSNPTVTAAYGIVMECPTVSATTQAGIYIKQRTAQQTATTRYGILIDAHTSGTTRWAIHADGDSSHFAGLDIKDATDIVLATGTGTKIGTATTQKLGFWNVTPVIQPATTGTASSMVAGGGAAVDDKATFTGGTGATAYRIDDVVLGLKQCGILKA